MNFGFIFSFLSIRWLQVVVNGKSSLKYPVNAYAPQGSILSLTLFLLYINGISDDIMCNIAIHADGTTLYSKYSEFDQAFDLWQQLEFASELESDLQDTVDWGRNWGRKWFVDFERWKNSTGFILLV